VAVEFYFSHTHKFLQNVFVLDLGVPPQIVPGSEEVSSGRLNILPGMNIYTYAAKCFETAKLHLRYIGDPKLIEVVDPYTGIVIDPAMTTTIGRTYFAILTVLKLMLETPFIILLALMFRFAVKSTALIWLPLLWIIRQSQPGKRVLDSNICSGKSTMVQSDVGLFSNGDSRYIL
jgi:hypothetical protein